MTLPLENIWLLVDQITKGAKYVSVCPDALDGMAAGVASHRPLQLPLPKMAETPLDLVFYELIACSVMYCFWYGGPGIRPLGSNTAKLYRVLDEVFDPDRPAFLNIREFSAAMSINRFPQADRRAAHLEELQSRNARGVAERLLRCKSNAERLDVLVATFPGYASDLFLKRAVLLLMQVARRMPVFDLSEDWLDFEGFPVPVDNHLPNVLRHKLALRYHPALDAAIESDINIPPGSRMEAEIRAHTVAACASLGEKAKRSPLVVDDWLFGQRKDVKNNFHLTVTSDY